MTRPIAAINHVSLTVNDLQGAIKFYQEVMGWQLIGTPSEVINDGGDNSYFCNTLYTHQDQQWISFKLAHMVGSNGVGIEVIQFEGNYKPELEFDYKRQGLSHFAITVPDVKEFVENFKAHGGQEYSIMLEYPVSEYNYVNTIYLKDPYGVIFEAHNHDYVYLNKNC